MKFKVFEFEGTGGVALAMYNTDKVIGCFVIVLAHLHVCIQDIVV